MDKNNIRYYSKEYIESARRFARELPPITNTNVGFRERLVKTLQQDNLPKAFDVVNFFGTILSVTKRNNKVWKALDRVVGREARVSAQQWLSRRDSGPGCPVLHWLGNALQIDILRAMREVSGVTVLNHWADNFLLTGRRTSAVSRMMDRNYELQLVPVESFCGFKYQVKYNEIFQFKVPNKYYSVDWEVTLTDEVIRRIKESKSRDNFTQWYLHPYLQIPAVYSRNSSGNLERTYSYCNGRLSQTIQELFKEQIKKYENQKAQDKNRTVD